MIFEQIYRQILRAYANIGSKNFAIKRSKMAILATKWSFERSLIKKGFFMDPVSLGSSNLPLNSCANISLQEKVTLAHQLMNGVNKTMEAASSFFTHLKNSITVMKAISIAAIVVFPVALIAIVQKIFKFRGQTTNERIDTALSISGDLTTIGTGLTGFTGGLVTVGRVAASAVQWVPPLLIATSVLNIFSFISTVKSYKETKIFIKEFEEKEKPDSALDLVLEKEKPDSALDLVLEKEKLEKSFVAKHLNIDGNILKKHIEAIKDNALKGHDKTKEATLTLKNRLKSKLFSNKLQLLMMAVGIVAAGLLFTPAAPFVLALVGPIAIIGVILEIKAKRDNLKFEKEFEALAKAQVLVEGVTT